jgi:hypothetical protein
LVGHLGGKMGLGAPHQRHDVAAEVLTRSPPGVVDVESDELPAGPDGDGEQAVLAARFTNECGDPPGQLDGALRPRVDAGHP